MDDLPISHNPWQKKPSGDKKAQLKIISRLLKQTDKPDYNINPQQGANNDS